MNTYQEVFVLFYAIFWGIISNAQVRWKAHHWPFLHVPQARDRLLLSIVVLNILPVTFFALALWSLAALAIPQSPPSAWTLRTCIGIVFFGVLPAYAFFGFYRLWLGLMETNPDRFYVRGDSGQYVTEDEEHAKIHLTPTACAGNLLAGLSYILGATIPLIVSKCSHT